MDDFVVILGKPWQMMQTGVAQGHTAGTHRGRQRVEAQGAQMGTR